MGCDSFITGDCPANKPGQGAGGGGATELNDLTDVNVAGSSDGEVLRKQGSEWVGDNLAIDDLSDVDTSGATEGQVLKLQGGTWVAADESGDTPVVELGDGTASLSLSSPVQLPAFSGAIDSTILVPFDTIDANTSNRATVDNPPVNADGILMNGTIEVQNTDMVVTVAVEPVMGETPFVIVQMLMVTVDEAGNVTNALGNDTEMGITPGDPATMQITRPVGSSYEGHLLGVLIAGLDSGSSGVPVNVTSATLVSDIKTVPVTTPTLDVQAEASTPLASGAYTPVTYGTDNSFLVDVNSTTGAITAPKYEETGTFALSASFTPVVGTATITDLVIDLVLVGTAADGTELTAEHVLDRLQFSSATPGETITVSQTVSDMQNNFETWSGAHLRYYVRATTDDSSDITMDSFSISCEFDETAPLISSYFEVSMEDLSVPSGVLKTLGTIDVVTVDEDNNTVPPSYFVTDAFSGISAMYIEAVMTPAGGISIDTAQPFFDRRDVGNASLTSGSGNDYANSVVDEVVTIGNNRIDQTPELNRVWLPSLRAETSDSSDVSVTGFKIFGVVRQTGTPPATEDFEDNDALTLIWQGV